MLNIEIQDKTGLKELAESFGAKLASRLDKISSDLRIQIITRTKGGTDAYGRSFSPYKPFTVQKKLKKGQQISPVNLTDTGEMLASVVNRIENDNEIVLQITAKQDIATELQTGRPDMAAREFFALDDAQIDSVIDQALDFI